MKKHEKVVEWLWKISVRMSIVAILIGFIAIAEVWVKTGGDAFFTTSHAELMGIEASWYYAPVGTFLSLFLIITALIGFTTIFTTFFIVEFALPRIKKSCKKLRRNVARKIIAAIEKRERREETRRKIEQYLNNKA